jgi:hypothetical protein
MKKRSNFGSKKAQNFLGMSFSTIFSIILIISFIIAAIIAISTFLNFQKCAQIKLFIENFQEQIDESFASSGIKINFKSNIPSSIKKVCFMNLSKELNEKDKEIFNELEPYVNEEYNMYIHPKEKACDLYFNKIRHLNINKITIDNNPFCINVENGKLELRIEKTLSESLVSLK